jgi:hypothetical protein
MGKCYKSSEMHNAQFPLYKSLRGAHSEHGLGFSSLTKEFSNALNSTEVWKPLQWCR